MQWITANNFPRCAVALIDTQSFGEAAQMLSFISFPSWPPLPTFAVQLLHHALSYFTTSVLEPDYKMDPLKKRRLPLKAK